ncbi:MAG: right-handed parallel beta-helix repeat-containing protein [Candidatus Micrarchaeota archaeon]
MDNPEERRKAQGALDYILTVSVILLVVVLILVFLRSVPTETKATVRAAGLDVGLLADPEYAAPFQVLASNYTANSSAYVSCRSTDEILECKPVHVYNDGDAARLLTVVRYSEPVTVYNQVVPPKGKVVFDIRNPFGPVGYWKDHCYVSYWDGDPSVYFSWSLGLRTACSAAGYGGGAGGGGGGDVFPTASLNEPPDGGSVLPGTVLFNYTPVDDVGFSGATLYVTNASGTYSAVNGTPLTNNSVNSISFDVSSPGSYSWNVTVCDSVAQCTGSTTWSFVICGGGVTNISYCPYTINCSGEYHVNTSLLCAGNGVIVNTSDVVIDCLGNTLTGPAAVDSYGIKANDVNNVTVHDCNITKFDFGAYFGRKDVWLVIPENFSFYNNNLYVNGYGLAGAGLHLGDGIEAMNASYNYFNENNYGVYGGGFENSSFKNNTVVNNVQMSVMLLPNWGNGIADNSFEQNYFEDEGIYSLWFDPNCNTVNDNNSVDGNNFTGGIRMSEMKADIKNNFFNSSAQTVINYFDCNFAFFGCTACGALVENNTIYSRGSAFVKGAVRLGAENSTVRNNSITVTENPGDGIDIFRSQNNVVSQNTLTSCGAGPCGWGGSGIAFQYFDATNNTVDDNNITGFYYGVSFSGGQNNTVSNNNASANGFGLLMQTNCMPGYESGNCAANVIAGNYFDDSSNGNGVALSGCYNATSGVMYNVTQNTLQNNFARRSAAYGLRVLNYSLSNSFSGNNYCNSAALYDVYNDATAYANQTSAADTCGINLCYQVDAYTLCTPPLAGAGNCSAICP